MLKKINFFYLNERFNQSHGMSMVSVLIGSAIMITVIMTVTSYMNQIIREFQRMNDKTAYSDLFEEFKSDLMRDTQCTDTLKMIPVNTSLVGDTAPFQPLPVSTSFLFKQFPYLNQPTQIVLFDKLQIQLIKRVSTNPDIYKSKIRLIGKKSTQQTLDHIKPKNILALTEVKGSQIEKCSLESSTSLPEIVRVTQTYNPNLKRGQNTLGPQGLIELTCPQDSVVISCLATSDGCINPPCVARHLNAGRKSEPDPKDPNSYSNLTISTIRSSDGKDICRFGFAINIDKASPNPKKWNNDWFLAAKCLPGKP